MDIGRIDSSATLGDSWLHRASPKAKLLAFGFILLSVVVTWNILVIASLALLLAAVVASARVSPRLAYGLAAYPALFALIFALASAPDLMTGAVIVLKAMTAALAAVTIVLTTPYPYVFAPVQKIVPTIVGDALLMTYRSLFILLEKFSNLLRAVRLRSGLARGGLVASGRASMQAMGGLLLYSFDLSQRDYDIMRVRGYSGRLRVTVPPGASRIVDFVVVIVSAVAAAVSIVWRVRAEELNPYSWMLPIIPLVLFLIALAVSRRKP
jgi:energy-coupling factor transporter transmembrane protein EcfT